MYVRLVQFTLTAPAISLLSLSYLRRSVAVTATYVSPCYFHGDQSFVGAVAPYPHDNKRRVVGHCASRAAENHFDFIRSPPRACSVVYGEVKTMRSFPLATDAANARSLPVQRGLPKAGTRFNAFRRTGWSGLGADHKTHHAARTTGSFRRDR
jgi:hypothetical protein